MWRGGCIIRSVFLKDITNAFRKNPKLENLLFDGTPHQLVTEIVLKTCLDFFNKAIHKGADLD